jgi:branched-chain amino acid transport system permease protein
VGELSRAILEAGVYGLLVGALYALVAIGVVLIFRATRTVNFAHGHFAALGGFVFLQVSVLGQQPTALGLAAAVGVVSLVALAWGRVAQSMRRRGNDLVPLVGSLGLFVALDGLLVRIWGGGQPYQVASLLPRGVLRVGDLPVDTAYVWMAVTAGVLFAALVGFFRFTDLGLRMRASVQNPEAAELMGIPTARLALYAWLAGSLLALVALMLYVPRAYLENTIMMGVLIRAFAASSVGGFESFGGAILGALVLGVAEALAGRFVGNALESMVALVLVTLMIFASPKGVFVVRGERA